MVVWKPLIGIITLYVQCLITPSIIAAFPQKNSKYKKKHWWNDELDDLHHQVIAATTFWRPRSGVHVVNDNRLQWKYRYKLAIKQAEKNAYEIVNEELFEYFNVKDDTAFWHAWRKKYCSSSSVKTASTQ